ncbi:MAG: PilZ domain-containing protein [SAR324 cluster bacterium]|nr:PilZ domain-containing protein [SAR324 cluster bacterium]
MPPSDQSPNSTAVSVAQADLATLFAQRVALKESELARVKANADQGLESFNALNEARLQLAFEYFDEDMRKALFEILFLLHVNDPKLAEWKYTARRYEDVDGVRKQVPRELTANLYLEGAPCGVRGIENLSPVFRDAFQDYVRDTFGMSANGRVAPRDCPIIQLSAGGSIATIGHKSGTSDLDLNVMYDLTPFQLNSAEWSNETFAQSLAAEESFLLHRERREQGISREALHDPSVSQRLQAKANSLLAKAYPRLFAFFMRKETIDNDTFWGDGSRTLRAELIDELMRLMKHSAIVAGGDALQNQEARLKERVLRIEEYLTDKFSAVEIHLFPVSNEDFRMGRHASTLDSKESPGSAYDLILNYEILMPGVQFTPSVPMHYLVDQELNNNQIRYNRFVDYIRFDMLEPFSTLRDNLIDIGAAPDLSTEYVAKHRGAVYWEAFKASSGNLPKATLNLFRFEMLLDKQLLKTNIQLLKEPELLDAIVTEGAAESRSEPIASNGADTGISNSALMKLEAEFPPLKQDPWWLRYKALKFGFLEEHGVAGLAREERKRASRIIDLAFALHVRISDIFTKPGDTRAFDIHREQVLLAFLERAFPPKSTRRIFLHNLFSGDVRAITQFEDALRDLFTNCLERVNRKIAEFKLPDTGHKEEFDVWQHYYQQNFHPAPNVIQRSIMIQLKVPRGRLMSGYDNKRGWVFRSVQRESSLGKRFDTFGVMDHLPDEVDLHDGPSFLGGLAHCIINGYYGTVDKGTLNERRTVLEFDAKAIRMGHEAHDTLAFVRPDQVERIMERVNEVFPYRPYHYLDCIRLERVVNEVFVFLNLLIFGRLSILYRDNLQTWRCDEFDHTEMLEHYKQLSASPSAMMTAPPIHQSLNSFFQEQQVRLHQVRLAAWVNPNSLKTSHGPNQFVRKEQQLAEEMENIILNLHRAKAPPEIPPAIPREAETSPRTRGSTQAKDWEAVYYDLMQKMGLGPEKLRGTGKRKHERFKPRKASGALSVHTGDQAGELLNISVGGLAFSSAAPISEGQDTLLEIEGSIIARVRITNCREQAAEGYIRVGAQFLDKQQGYQCFVRAAGYISGQTD